MTKLPILLSAAALALTGCAPQFYGNQQELADARIALAASFCARGDNPRCRFVNTPVELTGNAVKVPGRAANFFRTADRLSFTDGRNATWLAPSSTLTDGASIPRIFIPIVGSPTDPAVINAAAVHDAHCGIGNEQGPEFHSRTWEETHRMFYDALRVGGTPELKAKIMFAAVYLGGPRWDEQARDLSRVEPEKMQNLMRKTRSFIRATKPSVPMIEAYIEWHERDLIKDDLHEDSNRFNELEGLIGGNGNTGEDGHDNDGDGYDDGTGDGTIGIGEGDPTTGLDGGDSTGGECTLNTDECV